MKELRSNEENYILIIGEYGIGKALIYNYLVDHLKEDENVSPVVVPNPGYFYCSILIKLILEEIDSLFGFESVEDGQDEVLDYITNKSRSLDDTQNIDLINNFPKFLSLDRIAISDKPCLKFVIFGHLNLLTLLIYSNDDKAIVLINEYSLSIPRLVNKVCSMALRIGADEKSFFIDSNIITEVISVLSQIQSTLVDEKGQEPINGNYKDPHLTTHDEPVIETSKPSKSDRKLVRFESKIPVSSSFADLEKIKLESNMVFYL